MLFFDHLYLQVFVPDLFFEDGDVGLELVYVVLEVADLLLALVELLIEQGLLLVALNLEPVDVLKPSLDFLLQLPDPHIVIRNHPTRMLLMLLVQPSDLFFFLLFGQPALLLKLGLQLLYGTLV